MTVGYSGTPLARKLGIRPGLRVGAMRPPAHLAALLDPLPAGVRVRRFRRDGPPYDVLLLFARDRPSLQGSLDAAVGALDPAGGLWICWPKKSSPLHRDLVEDDLRELLLPRGLVDNKVCAVDGDWSGLRFVVRLENRPRV